MVGAQLTTKAQVFDLQRGRHLLPASADVGWITGHSYIVYGPLLERRNHRLCTKARPNYAQAPTASGSIIARHKITILYTAPTAVRAFMKWPTASSGHVKHYDLSLVALAWQRRRADQP